MQRKRRGMRASGASARGALGRWLVEVSSRKGEYLTADRNFPGCEGRRAKRGGVGGEQKTAPRSGECEWGGGKARPKRRGDTALVSNPNLFMREPKYFLYARKSTEDDDRQVMSIEAQLVELRELARKENLEILAEFQESRSAKTPGRTVFGEMMTRIEAGEAQGILAWHPDRLARNSIDGGRVIYAVDTAKIASLRFPTFWFSPTPQGLFMLQVAFGQSKYYSDNLSENIKRGVRQKLRRGEWLNRAPFGYENNPRVRNIEPHPTNARIVKLAYEEYAKGTHSLISLGAFLADLCVVTKYDTPLAKASLKRFLTNRAYLGFIKHNGEWFDGSFEPILTPASPSFRVDQSGRGAHGKIGLGIPRWRCAKGYFLSLLS